MNTLFVEPFSGMSGDMFLGALSGLADAYDEIVDLPTHLKLPDGKIEISEVSKNGIVCKHVEVIDLNEGKSDHHHHSHGHEHHHHAHRHLSDILEIIDAGDIEEGAKAIARDIFRLIGEAESAVHDIPIEKIHFHEISAVDSIIDIVGSAVLLHRLKIERTICRPICIGYGMVNTQHGLLPVPAPATSKLLQGMPTYRGEEKGERVTPTGAAILRYLKPEFAEDPPLVVEKEAYGPGKKDFTAANVLRLSLVSTSGAGEQLFVVETNLDDSSPEMIGDAFQSDLLAVGARDFTITNALMKKGRPGVVLSVLVEAAKRDAISDFLLERTSAIGVRYYSVERKILERKAVDVETAFGVVRAKQVTAPSGKKRVKAEYDSVTKIAKDAGATPCEVKRAAERDDS